MLLLQLAVGFYHHTPVRASTCAIVIFNISIHPSVTPVPHIGLDCCGQFPSSFFFFSCIMIAFSTSFFPILLLLVVVRSRTQHSIGLCTYLHSFAHFLCVVLWAQTVRIFYIYCGSCLTTTSSSKKRSTVCNVTILYSRNNCWFYAGNCLHRSGLTKINKYTNRKKRRDHFTQSNQMYDIEWLVLTI